MNFNTLDYYLFFVVVFFLFWMLPLQVLRRRLLVLASFLFYSFWDYRFFTLILVSATADYTVSLLLQKTKKQNIREILLFVSVGINIVLLATFKYFYFFLDSINFLRELIGNPEIVPEFSIVLPLGISFYTFQTMSYTFDVYRKQIEAEKNFLDYFLYVSFFPQLVAGPIERFKDLMPQFFKFTRLNMAMFSDGLFMLAAGVFLKGMIADSLGKYVDYYFFNPVESASATWVAVFSFGYQIYIDFWSYTLIARGSAKLLGIDLQENFKQPYLSVSPSQFWRKWHITLSSWFRDYVYIPLGGSRKLRVRNLFFTMALAGLWHGSSILFILWGVYHGILLILFLFFRPPRIVSWALTYLLVQLGWILFRSENLQAAQTIAANLFSGAKVPDLLLPSMQFSLVLILFCMGLDLILEGDRTYRFRKYISSLFQKAALPYVKLILASTLLFIAVFFADSQASKFIYFNF